MTEARTWRQFAREVDGTFRNVGPHRRFVEMYGAKKSEVLEVLCTEDAEGTHYGWIEKGEDTPTIIQHWYRGFSIQFPYTPEDAVKRGKGEIVRMRVEEIR